MVETRQAHGAGPGRGTWLASSRGVASRWDVLAVIAAGGALGSLARWALSRALVTPSGGFPWATFVTNVSGSLLIGVLMVLVADVWPPSRHVRPFLGIGVLGGYTTFSTSMLDARSLIVGGHAVVAGAYVAATLAAGLAAVWAGVAGARWAVGLPRRRARWREGGHSGRTGSPLTIRRPR